MLVTKQKSLRFPLLFKKYIRAVNVEPMMVMVAFSFGFFITSQSPFMYWARCVQIARSTEGQDLENATVICAQLSVHDDLQNIVEKDIASTKIFLQAASTVPTMITAPLIGTWSDKRGRKNPLLYTIFGFSIYMLLQLLATLTYEHINIYYWYFAAEFLIGLTGSVGSMFSTSLTIVTDDCRHKLRPGSSTVPIRIGVASFLQSFGTCLGTFGMTTLAVPANFPASSRKDSYIGAALIQFGSAALAWVYAFFMVRETHFPLDDGYLYNRLNSQLDASPSVSSNTHVEQPKPLVKKLQEYISALVDVLTQKRPGWTRCCLMMSLFLIFVEFLAMDASLLFLYVKRRPFSWSDKLFSYFNLVRGVLFSVGMVVCPLLLTLVHWLGKDSLMIIIGMAASAISFLMISLAHTTKEIFITTAFGVLCGGIAVGYRSFLPRMVPKEQTARLLTVCSIIMAFCPMISAAIFNSIFNATIEWWPGFAFFVGGLLQLFVLLGQGSIHILMRPQWRIEKQLKEQMMAHTLTIGDENGRRDGEPPTSATDASDHAVMNVVTLQHTLPPQ
ncbi:hypothetical protein RB195_014201 [Necator americanus]|uniref:Uncharacterized protein n=2 Tax=Necator americanus TaxID=51031 RepID=A0ABR1DZ20_NECAM|nr:hypothetical protein NECAME_08157 [Necator americanus]ETN82107.1 hypothetical protein NECAME_08157 [Necator americanus]